MIFLKSGIRWSQPYRSPTLVLIHQAQKLNALLPLRMSLQKTTNSNSVLPNTASNGIQQHVNSDDVDIRNLTITLIRRIVLQRSWYQMPGCSVQCKMKINTHGYMTVWYTKGIYGGLWFFVSFRIFFSDNTRVRIFLFVAQCAKCFSRIQH